MEGRRSFSPKVVESRLGASIEFSSQEWKNILKYERKENLSYSILLNTLRKGIKPSLRPRIWAFLAELEDTKQQHVN